MTDLKTLSDFQTKRCALNRELLHHPLFRSIDTLPKLKTFMEFHVFAVWDFMSLITSLKLKFTGIALPWMPPADPVSARLINEIVLAEESDEDGQESHASHFEMYLAAMEELGASTRQIRRFASLVSDGQSPRDAMEAVQVDPAIFDFVNHILSVAIKGPVGELMGHFFYGREEMIPQLFEQLLKDWSIDPGQTPRLYYYLERHIKIDRDEHGTAAAKLMARWAEGDESAGIKRQKAACEAIASRIALWDGAQSALDQSSSRSHP